MRKSNVRVIERKGSYKDGDGSTLIVVKDNNNLSVMFSNRCAMGYYENGITISLFDLLSKVKDILPDNCKNLIKEELKDEK